MPVKALVRKDSYYDSVKLMTVSSHLNRLPGVEAASVAMGTPLNLDLLRDGGLTTPAVEGATPNDLVVAVRASSDATVQAALDQALSLLSQAPAAQAAAVQPRTLSAAAKAMPGANLASISVPGKYAALEAGDALRAGLHVFLFSDNVPIEDEIRLKRMARDQGLLLMGPDCGTAIINGVGLGFANAVRRGPIGVVGASGTGIQQVTCLIDALGSGISQAIGTGGRDLHADVGGITMCQGVAALGTDVETSVIVLVSKPPAPDVAKRVLEVAATTGKPVVAMFLGGHTRDEPEGVHVVRTLTEAAERAVALASGAAVSLDEARPEHDLEELRAALQPDQRYVRGLFGGGTLCEEALLLLSDRIGPIYSNIPLAAELALQNPSRPEGNALIDLGADEFTLGRAHPMIDPTLRNEWLRRCAADHSVACLLLDVVLGYGSHPDPTSQLGPVLEDICGQVEAEGRTLPIVVSLCGAEGDPQGLSKQERALHAAGALVYRSNAAAARAAAALISVPEIYRQATA